MHRPSAHRRVRWLIFACLFGFSFFGYIERTEITVLGESVMRDLGLSQVMFGWLLTLFLVGYTSFQIPGAMLGESLGARNTLTLMGCATLLALGAIAVAPPAAGNHSGFIFLAGAQLLLGAAQAALFPVASGAIKDWFPAQQWGTMQGLMVTGLWIGSAVTPPALSALLLLDGWRTALLAVGLPAAALLAWWQYYARDRPQLHADVSPAELAELAAEPCGSVAQRVNLADLLRLLVHPQLLLVTASYFLLNYVFYLVTFWAFFYLRQERHLALLESGWLASLPFLTAAIASAVGGRLSDTLTARLGTPWGLRILPLIALPSTALFLWVTGHAASAYVAVATLCLAFGCCEVLEGAYWSAAMRIAPADSMTATSMLNTGGNLGGVVATPAIAALSAAHQWSWIFAVGALASLCAAALWLWVTIDSPSSPPEAYA